MHGSWNIRLLRRALISARQYANQSSSAEIPEVKTYQDFELDPSVANAIENKTFHYRKHPGVFRDNVDSLPDTFIRVMQIVTEGYKKSDLAKEAQLLSQRLWGRHLPPEEQDYLKRIKEEKNRVNLALEDHPYMGLESPENREHMEEKLVIESVKSMIHPWHPMNITPEACLQYLVSRTTAEFCILHSILRKLQSNDPDFVPRTFFDFGSGVGSAYWALTQVWKRPLMEAFLVDTNINMNELASKILRESKVHVPTGFFIRQYLPATPEPTYDLVLSAFTLLELPSFKDRMESIATLWSKTDKYLVIVEDGTLAGFKAVQEARDLILHLSRELSREGVANVEAHVVAPCPHDMQCPRFLNYEIPCNFKVSYLSPTFLEGRQVRKTHLYSYVVLQRGSRSDNTFWPRCVEETLKGSKKVHLTLCTPEGELEKVTLLKKNVCRTSYKCAKKTKWGDLLPGQIVRKEKENHVSLKEGSNNL